MRNRLGLVSAAGLVAGVLAVSSAGGTVAHASGGGADLWQRIDIPSTKGVASPAIDIVAPHALAFSLNGSGMAGVLERAPLESIAAAKSPATVVSLPTPAGGFEQFAIQESPVMAPELAARYPEITSYSGQGIDDPTASIRIDESPSGFHAQVLSPAGDWYIDPYYHLDQSVYVSYLRSDLVDSHGTFVDGDLPDGLTASGARPNATAARSTGTQLHTYRLAVAADSAYSLFQGNTKPLVLAAIGMAVSRVTGIYQIELSAKLVLVANDDSLIYINNVGSNGADPYDNDDAENTITQNQTNVDAVIGNGNYDVGHVFTTGAGGLASLGVIGVTGHKAQGVTGTSNPTGDAYWVDYVAHELGHEFGGDHTFQGVNGSCSGNGSSSTDVEPGSGSTIMAYAGICGADDLQDRSPGSSSDPYFSAKSYDQIEAVIDHFPGAMTATGNNVPAVAPVGGSSFIVPVRTPFALTASGTDPDGDALTYGWEQYDTGPLRALGSATKSNGALFRSQIPTVSAVRYFPKLASVAANNTDANGGTCGSVGTPAGLDCNAEFLPTTARTMHFRVTARDSRAAAGGLNSADATVVVAGSAPFKVTSPNTTTTYASGSTQTVTWDVAGTNATPFNTANVDICMSSDGGLTFPTLLAGGVPNNGSASVALPNTSTTHARIVVKASGGIFFDMSDADVTLSGGSGALPAASASCSPTSSGSGTGGGGGGTTASSFVPLVPARLLDSRVGFATADGVSAGIGVRAAGTVTPVTVTGRGGVAGDASAVVLNVTVTGAQGEGFVTVFPCGSAQPLASNLNYVVGQTIPNAVISKVGDGGQVCIYNKDPLDVIVDVTGFFPAGSSFVPLVPARLLDSRVGFATADGVSAGIGVRAAGTVTPVTVTGRGGVAGDASAVVLNVTVTGAQGEGFVTVFPCGSAQPLASNLNYVVGQTIPNAVISKVGDGGQVCIYNKDPLDVIVDVTGFFPAGSSFVPLVPARLLDSRVGFATADGVSAGIGVRAAGTVTPVTVTGRGGVAGDASAVVLNVTVTGAQGEGFVTVFPCGSAQPLASNLNYVVGQTIPNAVISKVGDGGQVCIYNKDPLNLLVDVTGFFPAAG